MVLAIKRRTPAPPEILSQDFTKKVRDLSEFPSQLMNLVNFIHFGGLICL